MAPQSTEHHAQDIVAGQQLEVNTLDTWRPAVDMEFSNLTYTVKGGKKTILHGVSGQFRAGQLSAILGTSGAGKSSLMDILIGYKCAGVTGNIRTNGVSRNPRIFHKYSCYIQQEEVLQPQLSVLESMNIAAQLKLNPNLTKQQRDCTVLEILTTLGLEKCCHTRMERLSGGQRKRLSIALEMLSNPPVIFLDEPTTGLDVVSVSHCMQLLRSLALQGRTIVCTIHQPSASMFELFHHVYVLAEGRCVYQGAADQLVPFLASVNLPCPPYNNPADYVIELTQSSKDHVSHLSTAIQNGKLSLQDEGQEPSLDLTRDVCVKANYGEFPTSARQQFTILLHRMLLQHSRNTAALQLQFIHHVFSALVVGGLFLNAGQDAAKAYDNVKFCVSVMVFFMYTHVMTPVLLFPAEIKLLKREYFNRWYGLKPYFFAMSVSRLPLQIILTVMFVAGVYVATSQPLEPERIFSFTMICLLVAAVSESLGLVVGTLFNITNGSVFGPAIATPMLMLSIYGVGYGELIETSMKIVMSLSYLRFAAAGLVVSMLGQNREPLDCSELYCHYRRPTLLLKDMGMDGVTVTSQMLALIIFLIFYRGLSFLALRYRLTPELNHRIYDVSAKILRRK